MSLPLRPERAFSLVFFFAAISLCLPMGAGAQVIPDTIPPPPDTIPLPSDTIPPPPDTIPLPSDTIPVRPGSLVLEGVDPDSLAAAELQADSIVAADTLPAVQLPALARVLPAGFETGVWEWDRDAILGAKSITLAELVAEIPGTVLLRGGDYGAPVSVSAFGAGGARIRVFRDGVELPPLEGSTPDLARVGLAGLQSVRVVRSVGGLRIELESMLSDGGRPLSLIEAGTGDLNTNLFRGTFANPRALGGVLALAMDRVDTQGPQGQEPGSSTGGWIRFARGIGSRGVFLVDYSKRSSDRGGTEYTPSTAGRTDWSLRTRWELSPGLVGDLFYSSSALETDEDEGFEFGAEERTQMGALLSFDSDWVKGLGRIQKISGEGLPKTSAFLEASGGLGEWGGVAGEMEWEDWGGEAVSRTRVRAWTAPRWGVSFFAERGSGKSGLPYLPDAPLPAPDTLDGGTEEPLPDTIPPVLPGPRFSENEGTRIGLSYRWRRIYLAGARLSLTADSLFPLGLPQDRTGITISDAYRPAMTLPGGTRKGFEVSGRVPFYPSGMSLVGSYQWWDQPEDIWTAATDSTEAELVSEDKIPWRYLPSRNYQASLSFHDSFYPTGNLEVWFDLGVAGRDAMTVPFVETVEGEAEEEPRYIPTQVPFFQSWFVRLQIRVVTVRVFFMWENFTVRQRNQDFPGRLLPNSRSLYGIRWTMWN